MPRKHIAKKIRQSYLVRNIIGVPIAFCILMILYITSHVAYNYFAPRSWFFDYKSMTATQADNTVELTVTRYTKKGVQLQFVDTLHCKQPNGAYVFFYYQTVEGFGRKTGVVTYNWLWEGRVPERDTVCYIQSLVTASLPYGAQKEQYVTTPPFKWQIGVEK